MSKNQGVTCALYHIRWETDFTQTAQDFVLIDSTGYHKCFKQQNLTESEQITNPVSVALWESISISETNIATLAAKASPHTRSLHSVYVTQSTDTFHKVWHLIQWPVSNARTGTEAVCTQRKHRVLGLWSRQYRPMVFALMDHPLQNANDKVWGNQLTKSIKPNLSTSSGKS